MASKISVEVMTSREWVRRATAFTTQNPENNVTVSMKRLYESEHSPIRTRWFWIELYEIPYFVHTHLRTHKTGGTEHFTQTGREDRGAQSSDRWVTVNHAIMINSQSLINMARKRLCNKAHSETLNVMDKIKEAIAVIDPDLASCMVPECEYRGGVCHELKSCGAM